MSTSSAFVPVVVCLDVVDLPTCTSAGRRICAAGQPPVNSAPEGRLPKEPLDDHRKAEACQAPARRRPVEARLPRAAQRQRAVQEGRQPAQRARPHRDIYSKQGFDSIDKQDLRGRMRWMGLYTQREQGYDGTWTGDENTDMLEAKYFMMRVRCDGGALTTQALRTLGEISTEFARDTADISDRENVQYHWIQIEDVPEIWERLAAVGLQTTEACGDCPRVVLGSPLAGESLDEVLDPTPAIDEIVRPLHRQAGVLQPAAQVQDRDLGPAGRRPRGQRRRVHRRQPSRARPRPRPVGRRRPVHQPDAGPAARRLGAAGRGARRLGGRDVGVPRLRLPAAARRRRG